MCEIVFIWIGIEVSLWEVRVVCGSLIRRVSLVIIVYDNGWWFDVIFVMDKFVSMLIFSVDIGLIFGEIFSRLWSFNLFGLNIYDENCVSLGWLLLFVDCGCGWIEMLIFWWLFYWIS